MADTHGHRGKLFGGLGVLKNSLGESKRLRRTAWHLFESLHRSVDARRTPPPVAGPEGIVERHAGPTAPTSPYGPPESDPLDTAPALPKPVLEPSDVTDFGAVELVADPFLYPDPEGGLHMFFEVYNHFRTPTAAIGHATSEDGVEWTYDRVVLEDDCHLSFPYVFRHEGTHYMVPDRWSRDDANPADVTLYRATEFPTKWEPVSRLVSPDEPQHDCVVFHWEGRWWALLGDGRNLWAYHAAQLTDEGWTPHAENPVVTDRPRAGRPGGRPLVRDDYVLAFLQESRIGYGDCVRGYRITELTPTTYADEEASERPVVEPPPGKLGWNSGFMHHFDPWADGEGEWWCAVDGNPDLGWRVFGSNHWAIGIYRSSPE